MRGELFGELARVPRSSKFLKLGGFQLRVKWMADRSFAQRLGYDFLRVFSRLVGVALFQFRAFGRDGIPAEGPVLVCANHQSFFDPLIVGLTIDRRMNFLARKTLFRFAPFRWLIEFLDAIPLDRDGLGVSGLKECLRRIKRGEMVLIFPEGTRTRDGEVGAIQPGFIMLARRGDVSVLPIGIDGAHRAWPRGALFPRLAAVRVVVGEPLTADQIRKLDDQQLLAEVDRRMRACHAAARDSLRDEARRSERRE